MILMWSWSIGGKPNINLFNKKYSARQYAGRNIFLLRLIFAAQRAAAPAFRLKVTGAGADLGARITTQNRLLNRGFSFAVFVLCLFVRQEPQFTAVGLNLANLLAVATFNLNDRMMNVALEEKFVAIFTTIFL